MSGKVVNRYAMAAVDSELVRAIVGNVSEVQTVAVDNAGDAHLNLDLRITVIVALTVSVGIWQVSRFVPVFKEDSFVRVNFFFYNAFVSEKGTPILEIRNRPK